MRLVSLFTDGPVTELVLGHGKHPDAVLYRTGWITERPPRTEYRDNDVMITLEVCPVLLADTPPVDGMVVYEEPGTDEVPLIRQRVGTYGIVLSERGLLGTVISRLTGAPGTWNLPGGGLDASEEPTAGLLYKVHGKTGQQVVPGRLLTLQLDHWIDHAPDGGLEGYHVLCAIYSATYEKPSRPRARNPGGLTARAD